MPGRRVSGFPYVLKKHPALLVGTLHHDDECICGMKPTELRHFMGCERFRKWTSAPHLFCSILHSLEHFIGHNIGNLQFVAVMPASTRVNHATRSPRPFSSTNRAGSSIARSKTTAIEKWRWQLDPQVLDSSPAVASFSLGSNCLWCYI